MAHRVLVEPFFKIRRPKNTNFRREFGGFCNIYKVVEKKINWAQNWHFAELLHPTVVAAVTSLHKTKDSHLFRFFRFRFYSILVTKLQGFIQKTNICQGIVPRYYRGCSNITWSVEGGAGGNPKISLSITRGEGGLGQMITWSWSCIKGEGGGAKKITWSLSCFWFWKNKKNLFWAVIYFHMVIIMPFNNCPSRIFLHVVMMNQNCHFEC